MEAIAARLLLLAAMVPMTTAPTLIAGHGVPSGKTLLMSSLVLRHNGLTSALLRSGADPNLADPNLADEPITPLKYACIANCEKSVELLLRHGATTTVPTGDELTPAHFAVSYANGSTEVLVLLHAYGADLNALANGRPPLFFACMRGDTKVVAKLLTLGADVERRAPEAPIPLHTAVFLGHTRIAEILLDGGADVNGRDTEWFTPLHTVLQIGASQSECRIEMAEMLLAHGADVNAFGGRHYSFSALTFAVMCKDFGVMRVLLKAGASVGVAKSMVDCAFVHNGGGLNVFAEMGYTLSRRVVHELTAQIHQTIDADSILEIMRREGIEIDEDTSSVDGAREEFEAEDVL